MNRDDLQRLSKDDLIELVLRLQRPDKTSRTSSKPPSTDRKERREQAKPGGAKPGHEGHSRKLCETPDAVEGPGCVRTRAIGARLRAGKDLTDRRGKISRIEPREHLMTF
jgi:hypothetical protein